MEPLCRAFLCQKCVFYFVGVRNPRRRNRLYQDPVSGRGIVAICKPCKPCSPWRSCRKRGIFNGVWKKSCSRPMGRYRTWRWAKQRRRRWHWVTLGECVGPCRRSDRWSKPSPSLVMRKWQKLHKIFGRRMQSCTSVWRSWSHVVRFVEVKESLTWSSSMHLKASWRHFEFFTLFDIYVGIFWH